jgi:hypothetical protein
MNTYKTYAQIDSSGRLVLEGLPFSAGSLMIDPKLNNTAMCVGPFYEKDTHTLNFSGKLIAPAEDNTGL